MILGYARVSTFEQTLDAQIDELTAAGADRVFSEKVSGAKQANRPQLAALLKAIKEGDTLLVTRLDRLARSTLDLLSIIEAISARGAIFRATKDSWANTDTPHGRLMVTILGGLAEFERSLILTRTHEGRLRAMAKGKKFGRKPILTPIQQAEARDRLLANEESITRIAAAYNVSKNTIKRLKSHAMESFDETQRY